MRTTHLLSLFIVVASAGVARAQDCEFPICPSGTSFQGAYSDASGPYASCGHCNWLGHCSHQLVRCPEDSWFDVKNAQCVWNVCSGCGGQLPLCDTSIGETYTGWGVYPSTGETYGVCRHESFGYISHRLVECRDGWSLVTGTGQCRKTCDVDLTVRNGFLRSDSGAVLSSVRTGTPYSVCFDVANLGTMPASSFRVTGGGLGVPVAPSVTISSLAGGASQRVCLRYATAPQPGTWRVGITADSGGAITETLETNNTLSVTVVVVP
jgi:hypothetical protein